MNLGTPTKALFLAAVLLLLLFLIGDHFGFRTNSKEPPTYVMELDTAKIIRIAFEDRATTNNGFALKRRNDGWERTDSADPGSGANALAKDLLIRFRSLKVKRDMGMIRLLGERYFLTDSTLCHVTFTENDDHIHALNLGSSTFAPGKVGSWTYVNVPGEREVYSVEGLLTMGLREH